MATRPQSSPHPNPSPEGEGTVVISARVVTLDPLPKLEGIRRVVVPPQAVLTPSVRDELQRRGVTIERRLAAVKSAAGRARLVLVAAGCAVILATALLVCWPLGPAGRIAVIITAGLFVPAGLPMILGSIRRHVSVRAAEQQRIIADTREILDEVA